MADNTDKPETKAREAEFVRLFTSHQLDIYLYVHSLVPDPNDAGEVLQNANVVLWEKREQFELGRDFRPWAFQVARYEVLKFKSTRKRKCLCFSDALVDELALEATNCGSIGDDILDEMRRCVAQLAARDRDVLNRRYSAMASCESIAKSIGQPVRWVYKALSRIRRELYDCVARHVDTRREP